MNELFLVDYTIVTGKTKEELIKKVLKNAEEGYTNTGGPFVVEGVWHQGMELFEEETAA